MNRKLVVVYEGGKVLGEAELHAAEGVGFLGDQIKDVRISHYSQPSERCPPLAVFHTINSTGICCKLESTAKTMDSPLSIMHTTCLKENKTAVLSIGGVEVHLVAMKSRKNEHCPCFWGFNVPPGLYNSCLAMLNMRCLGIVFDLDETLIVANTLRSFEDRIDSLQRKMSSESDPQRISTLLAEVKRYQEDKNILKQYAETDQITDNGKVLKAQSEVVLAMSDDQQTIVRPLIRLQDRNIILTRINPLIRDTSVLVRLRPAWEDLRSYLTAKGRKRFEVFVCTMAEGDYALEMWRLLDPESNLINPRDLLNRIVCVKAGSRKSLFNVFQDGICHPKMALVIDDRVKVWDEIDQPRVHIVPAFTPYSTPQAEANSETPVLCVARNVACNVRGGFFKEFDDGLLPRISEVAFEDDAKDIPPPPDVSSYLVSEDDQPVCNGVKDGNGFDGVADNEIERRLKEVLLASALPAQILSLDPRIASALQFTLSSSSFPVLPSKIQGPDMPPPSQQLQQVAKVLKSPLPQPAVEEPVLHGSPAREEGEVPESELDPDTRRRLLILQHGQDTREPSTSSEGQLAGRPPMQVNLHRVSPPGWFPVEEEMSPRQPIQGVPSVEFNGETIPDGRNWSRHAPFLHKDEALILPERQHENLRLTREELSREDMPRLNQSSPDFHQFSRSEDSLATKLSAGKIFDGKSGQIDPSIETFPGVLQEIAFQCGTKVEFKPALVSSIELQFSVEVFFAGQKIGKAIGNTRREAQSQAAEESVFYLARKYLSQSKSDAVYAPESQSKLGSSDFSGDANRGYQPFSRETSVPSTSMHEASRKSVSFISALKELCMVEGFEFAFQTRPHFSVNRGQKNEAYAEVEINGQVLGKGIGSTWEDAKSQAAEKALAALRSILSQPSYKRQASPRSMQQGNPSKRSKPEFSRGFPRLPASIRHPRSAS